ncbi:hypothetical protein NLJ89_g6614 [Agrocybe chaxingu]|uniref:Acetyl-CoA synthetase-like protein n=1 Tax=Agrocybe chaxingu TaxID=84603 RepID=A0A9W8JW51_9AGAR|nr:hypothetical protein NLJ89_g6614 [Agrocybe chaxingu]
MYLKSPYPDPPPLPEVNVHHILFQRPDQEQWPDYTVHIDPVTDERVSFREHLARIEQLSTALGAPVAEGGLGLSGEGSDVVGIMSENSSDYITLVHACLRITTPFALISSYSTPFELKHALSLTKVTRIFADAKFLKTVLPVAKDLGLADDKIYVMKDPVKGKGAKEARGRKSFWGFINLVRKRKTPIVDVRPAKKDTLAYLVFSSGTSGLPKAVMISHGNLIFSIGQSIVMGQLIADVYTPPTPKTPEGIPVTLAFLPLHHTYGLHGYCFRSCLSPNTLVLPSKWDIHACLKAIPKYKVTTLTLIPSVVHQIVNHPGIENVDFSSVLTMGSGAAYLPPELATRLEKLVPGETKFNEGYGMSEATIAAITQPFDGMLGGKLRRINGCTGVLLPGMEARTVREDGTEAGLNEPGELWLRSGNIAIGYWNNEKANRETFVDGWLHTGDTFRIDEEGYFWFADRAKDTLKVSGAQVSPVEIENCLLAHPDKLITDATVAGVSGGRTSDEKVPRAWVVLSPAGKKLGKEAVIKALQSWHQENLSKYKHLRGGIEIVSEIPKSPTGKTLRRVLQEKYEAQLKKKGKAKL